MSLRRIWGALAVASLAVGPVVAAIAADEPLWSRACAKDAAGREACVVEQFAVAMPQKAVALRIRFAAADTPEQKRMQVTVPLGVPLGPGLSLSVDGSKPIGLPFERCTAEGCNAVAVLDKAALANFTKGKTLTVRYAVSERAGADIPIKLDGLDAALRSLSK